MVIIIMVGMRPLFIKGERVIKANFRVIITITIRIVIIVIMEHSIFIFIET
jgi:hypothetical protein